MVVCIAQRIACSYFEYGFCIVGLVTTPGYLDLIIAFVAMSVDCSTAIGQRVHDM